MAITTKENAASFSFNENNEASYTRTFIVESDERIGPKTAAETVAVNFSIYPRVATYSTALEYDTTSLVQGYEATCIDDNDGYLWQVTITYGPAEPYADSNPLNEPYEVSWSTTQGTRICDFDNTGAPIVNYAFDFYSEPIEIDDPRFVLSITRNEGTFNTAYDAQYRNAVNSDVFFGYSPRCVKCSGISTQRVYDAKWGFFFKTTYQFDIDLNTFDKKVVDAGFRELKTVSGSIKRVDILVNGQRVQEPVPLSTSGQALPHTSTPITRTWKLYPELPFSVFGF